MGIVQNIMGMVRDINDRKRASAIDAQLKNYLNNPDMQQTAIAAINDIDPRFGMQFADKRAADSARDVAARNAAQDRALGTMRNLLRGLPEGADTDAAFQQMAPFMEQLGVPENIYGGFQSAVKANPNALLDDKAYEDMMKDRFTGTVVTPGSIYMRGGKEVTRAPYAMKAVTTQAGATSTPFDPNKGEFVTGSGGGGPAPAAPGAGAGAPANLTLETLRPLFVAQESSGDYTARNPETGALGRYQIMPDTGRALAKRVGVAWNPAMMTRDDPASRRYQDALGNAAIQEAIDYGQGDPMKVFGYYYGGSDTRRWGPKTRQYQQDMMGRLGGGTVEAPSSGATITPTSVTAAPKPAAPKPTYRAATPEEIAAAGYPKGTAAQIGSDGKMVNLKTPAASVQKANQFDYDKASSALTAAQALSAEARKVMSDPGLATATGSIQGRLPGWLIGQQGQDARNALKSLRSNVGLQQLMQMKSMSSQGASGFGNLSNAEGDRLERAFGSLDDTTDDAVIVENLTMAAQTLDRYAERVAWQMRRSDAGQSWKVPPEGTVQNGRRFIGGAPDNQANWIPVKRGGK